MLTKNQEKGNKEEKVLTPMWQCAISTEQCYKLANKGLKDSINPQVLRAGYLIASTLSCWYLIVNLLCSCVVFPCKVSGKIWYHFNISLELTLSMWVCISHSLFSWWFIERKIFMLITYHMNLIQGLKWLSRFAQNCER